MRTFCPGCYSPGRLYRHANHSLGWCMAHLSLPPEFSDSTSFSLFEGDLVSRLFARLGMGSYRVVDLIKRSLLLIGMTWVPLAILAILDNVHWIQSPGQNFFLDFAAYGQFILGLPLFLAAERVIDKQSREAARSFVTTGIIRSEDAPLISRLNRQVVGYRIAIWPELVCVVVAYTLTASWIIPELYNDRDTWHAMGPIGIRQPLTWPGVWEVGFALPLQMFWWLRWMWKIGLWCWYLYRASRFHLNLVASHPDRTGGIGFLSEAQTKFVWVILAYGISNIASTIGYKLSFEGAQMDAVWGPIVSFVVGAPLLFTVPLFMFTRQLCEAKTRAIKLFQARFMERALAFEEKWLQACSSGKYDLMGGSDLAGLNALDMVYDRLRKMRVVPFDMRSFSELVGSALGPMIPLLPYLIDVPEPWFKAFEEGRKLLH